MPYYPFQQMNFGPAHLFGSQIGHTMFYTDYILKFLTTGIEVQFAASANERDNNANQMMHKLRSIDEEMLNKLPEKFKVCKILDYNFFCKICCIEFEEQNLWIIKLF
jgi:hypothetical protein